MGITTVVFDAYGTLFDVTAAARRAGAEFPTLGDRWPRLAADWRAKQLEYTWIRALTGQHADFWQVTRDALDWVLEAAEISDFGMRERLLSLYRELDCFADAPALLTQLKETGLATAILSNGSPEMLRAAVESAGLVQHLDEVLSVETVGIYKPSPRVYDLVGEVFGARPREVLFVSANGWDVAGAAAYGFNTVWINRTGAPIDRLPGRPEHVLDDLAGIAPLIAGIADEEEVKFFTNRDGLRLAYRDEGAGPPLLCLAGLTRNMADFDSIERDFGHRARIIRLDTRGRGQSEYDPDPSHYNVIREGRDAIDLLDHLRIERTAILGTSRGGLIALALAATDLERLNGVCFNDIGPVIETEGLDHIRSYLGKTPPHADYDAAAGAMREGMAPAFPDVTLERWRAVVEKLYIETGTGLALRYDPRLRETLSAGAAPLPDLWPLFDRLADLPLALIRGENSNILSRETAEEMRTRAGNDLCRGAAPRHIPFLDEPQSKQAISEFLDRLS